MVDPLSLLPEDNRKRFDSRHRMVIAAAQRAKHLIQGAKPVSTSRFTKETSVGIEEVLHGDVGFLTDKDARQAIKDSKRGKESEVERLATVEGGEDAREIRKELSVYVDDSIKATEPESEE